MDNQPKKTITLTPHTKEWEDSLKRAKARYVAERKDWEQDFKNRMDFKEYKLRLQLSVATTLGYMATDQAISILKKYIEAQKQKTTTP